MFRRFLAVVALAVMGLLAVPALASAGNPPYPAPPVTPGTETWQPTATVVNDSYTALASTGAGINVGTFMLIGAVVVLVGVGLLVIGNRLRRSSQH